MSGDAWLELFSGLRGVRGGAEHRTMCAGPRLCEVAPGEPICDESYSSGDLKRSHACASAGTWDEECVRRACIAVSACAGYMRSDGGESYWLFGAPVAGYKFANPKYRCFARREFAPSPPPPLPPFSKPPAAGATRFLAYSVSAHEGFNLQLDVAMRMAKVVHSLGSEWELELVSFTNAGHWRRERSSSAWVAPWSRFFRVDRLPVPASDFRGGASAAAYTVLHLGSSASRPGPRGRCTCEGILRGASTRRGEFACDEATGAASVAGVGFAIGDVRCIHGEESGSASAGLKALRAEDVAKAVASLVEAGAPARVFLHAAEHVLSLPEEEADELQLRPSLWIHPRLQRSAHGWIRRRRVRPETMLAFHARRGDYLRMPDKAVTDLAEWPAYIAARVAQAEAEAREAGGGGGFAIESVVIATDGADEIRSALASHDLRWAVHLFDGDDLDGLHEGERAIVEQWVLGSFFSHTITRARAAAVHTVDHDELRAGMPFVHSLPEMLRTPWLVRCGDWRRYDAYAIDAVLAAHDASRPVCLGVLVHDESRSIIHHYADPGSRAYPLLEACVALSAPLIEKMRPHVPWNAGRGDFSIDPAYELSTMVERVGGELVDEPRLLLKPSAHAKPSAGPDGPPRADGEANEQCERREGADVPYSVGVKTTSAFHATRIPAWRQLAQGSPPGAVHFFSEAYDEAVPTVRVPVPNVERGHCEKLRWILGWMAERSPGWALIADDDTWLNFTAVSEHLAWREAELGDDASDASARPVIVGEVYRLSRVDYPTGGAGMLFNRAAAAAVSGGCTCSRPDFYDDIWVGECAKRLGIDVAHSSRFHQARPSEYHPRRLQLEAPPLSFHKTLAFSEDDRYLLAERGGN